MRQILTASAVAAFPLAAVAQEGHSMAGHGDTAMALPAAGETAAGSMDTSKMTEGPQASMAGGQMDEVQKANHGVMREMHGPMMKAAMIKDTDLALNCGMIAYLMGAIAMSEVELKLGKDEKSKEMARMIIYAQRQEIEEMTTRVEALAK